MDWAMQEALEEVDAVTPACPPIAPPRFVGPAISPLLANQQRAIGKFIEVDCTPDEMVAMVTKMRVEWELHQRGISPGSGLAMMQFNAVQADADRVGLANAMRSGRCGRCGDLCSRFDTRCVGCRNGWKP